MAIVEPAPFLHLIEISVVYCNSPRRDCACTAHAIRDRRSSPNQPFEHLMRIVETGCGKRARGAEPERARSGPSITFLTGFLLTSLSTTMNASTKATHLAVDLATCMSVDPFFQLVNSSFG